MKKSIREHNSMIGMVNSFLVDLPTPSSISYMWNFGSLLGMMMVIQILTGLFLAIQFSGESSISFFSVIHIMRDVSWGWMLRVVHSNGASIFFFFLYLHMGRGIYYGSYILKGVWLSGVSLYLMAMATAFLGYVLPWGQMSFWAATVITNLLSAIPYVGVMMVEWLWGGFAVGNPTLTRFFSFHFILPFVIIFFIIIHLMFLHETGSSDPLGSVGSLDKVVFHPYFVLKDLLGVVYVFLFLIMISLILPFIFMDSENFLMSDPMVTPIHIQPEWYFLFAYSILRSIPSSIGGVVALLMSVMIFYFFCFMKFSKFRSSCFYPFSKFVYWMMVINWILLTWSGSCVVMYPYEMLGRMFSIGYFFLFMFYFFVNKIQDMMN